MRSPLKIILLVALSILVDFAHAGNPDLYIQWQLRWTESESLPGRPKVSFISDNSVVGGSLNTDWVKKDGVYNTYIGRETLDGKRRFLLLEFIDKSYTKISPSQLFSIVLPYENCSEWSDWEKPKYSNPIEYGIDWAILNKRELDFVDQGNSPLFEIRYRVTSWTKLCDYNALTPPSSGTR